MYGSVLDNRQVHKYSRRKNSAGEKRVAITPQAAESLIKKGIRVVIERGAGVSASFNDDLYQKVGVNVVDKDTAYQSDIIFKVFYYFITSFSFGFSLFQFSFLKKNRKLYDHKF